MNKSKEIVNKKIKELGYLNYVDSNNLESVIEKTFEDYKEDGIIKSPWEGLNRIFGIDAESIYESNGIYDLIKVMLPIFKAMGIDLKMGKYVEEFDNNSSTYTKRTIELNEKTYDTSGSSDRATAFNSGFR